MKTILWLFLLVACSGCSFSPPTRVTSQHSKDLSATRLTQGGAVFLAATSQEPAEPLLQLAGETFRAKGFRIAPSSIGADYAFSFAIAKTAQPTTRSTVARSDLLTERVLLRRVVGQFSALHSDGTPGPVLWQGEARAAGFRFDEQTINTTLLRRLLERFPN